MTGLTGKKDQDLVKRRLDDLDMMLAFVNADIRAMNDDQFYNLIGIYVHSVMPDDSPTPFRGYTEKHYRFVDDLLSNPSVETVNRVKKFFSTIQSHLRSRVETVMYAMESEEPMLLWECKGTQRFLYDPLSKMFTDQFEPDGLVSHEKLDLETERRSVDSRLSEIVRDLGMGLKTGQFLSCKKCGGFFFHRTGRERIYCSRKCAKAEAQANYMKGKKERRN